MSNSPLKPALLLLEDGSCFHGKSFGFKGTVFGEIVFNTGMTGYQEVITDPSYFGQIVTFTYPELGNTGANSFDQEADFPHVKGIVSRNFSGSVSNWRSEESFEFWLQKNKIVGICGIDTRTLVRHIRQFGAMNSVISSDEILIESELLNRLGEIPSMEGLNLTQSVTTTKAYEWNSICKVDFDSRKRNTLSKENRYKVVVIDFGVKKSILQRLSSHGCDLIVLPADTTISDVLKLKPDGIFLSNGPGDPSAVITGIELAKKLIQETELPLFGICLGHQILGLAVGGRTFKLKYGHRGLNHPCGKNGRLEITSQNHGFALDPKSLQKEDVEITHMNLNDKTVAGIALKKKPVFGIQYHPEASPGPHDADHHFARFVELMAELR